jgi:hypothetical protein
VTSPPSESQTPHCRHHVDLCGLNRVGDGDERWDDLCDGAREVLVDEWFDTRFSMLSYASESILVRTANILKGELRAVN